jgi:hypothetical protein
MAVAVAGVLDEDDAYGIMDDYVTHDTVESYEDEVGDDGGAAPRGALPMGLALAHK